MAACANSANELALTPQPALANLSTSAGIERETAVRVTERCRALSKQVKTPKDWPGKDPKASRREYMAALKLANTRLGAADDCIGRLVEAYAKGLPQ